MRLSSRVRGLRAVGPIRLKAILVSRFQRVSWNNGASSRWFSRAQEFREFLRNFSTPAHVAERANAAPIRA
jgi:hypothetical protein